MTEDKRFDALNLYVPTAFAVLFLGLFFLMQNSGDDSRYISEFRYFDCPISVSKELENDGANDWPRRLVLYEYFRRGRQPTVDLRAAPDGRHFTLTYTNAKRNADGDVDFRIGYVLPDVRHLYGRNLRLLVKFWSDKALSFPGAQLYFFDGRASRGIGNGAPRALGPEAKEFALALTYPSDALAFEIWWRLAIGKDARFPESGTIHMQISIAPGRRA